MINVNMLYRVFIIIFVLFQKLLHLTYEHSLWCARAFIRRMYYFFTTFIHTNITIMWFFFLFIHAQSIFLALITICTWSLFMSIQFPVVYNFYITYFRFLTIRQINFRLNFSFDSPVVLLMSNLIVFDSFST